LQAERTCGAIEMRNHRTRIGTAITVFYTIGHSTRSLEELVEVLHAHSIEVLVDIRAFPGSRRSPHFDRESLEKSLPQAGIRYLWMKQLGGHRKKSLKDSPNLALRNQSFRNYADYMLTPEFTAAVAAMIKLGEHSRTVYMCAERVYFHCHRMLVSDWLVAHGYEVFHIEDQNPARPHQLMAEAKLEGGRLIYGGDLLI
jgi:uncharacterized protein (DUF488 family)